MPAHLFIRSLASWFLALGAIALTCQAEEPSPSPVLLTNVAQIRALPVQESAQALPGRLTGVVVGSQLQSGPRFIVADETGGIYVHPGTNNPTVLNTLRRGDFVELTGVTSPGEFAPIFTVRQMRKLGTAPIPPAQPATYQQLITGALDAQWVEVRGVVRRVFEPWPNSDIWRIVISADGGLIPVRFLTSSGAPVKVDSEVRIEALCFYQFNQRRQVLNPILEIPPGARLQVEKAAPPNPFDSPIKPATNLLIFSPQNLHDLAHRVHVRGIVTYSQSGSLTWIRDGSTGLRILTDQPDTLHPGDEIDVLGFPTFRVNSYTLENSAFRKSRTAPAPAPIELSSFKAAFDHEDDLVSLDGRLIQIDNTIDGLELTMSRDTNVLKATLRVTPEQRSQLGWQPGSHVRITGICSFVYDDARPFSGKWQPKSFQVLLRNPADLQVIQPPPWWTLTRITLLLGIATGTMALAVGVVLLISRKRLHEQKRQREMAEAEFAAILTERNRLAREIHDTLAQGLAATSVQLRLARKNINDTSDAAGQHLDAAQKLVRESLEEARNSIWNMRSHVLEQTDLPSALNAILKQMADGSETAVSLECRGRVRRLAPVIENNILRVGQEAITNAIKHSKAGKIQVTLDFLENQFQLKVTDDGCGFGSRKPGTGWEGFGLTGMQERAAELKGELAVHSQPGTGTWITLNIPLSGSETS